MSDETPTPKPFPPIGHEAFAAYNTYPIARVLVEAICEQLGMKQITPVFVTRVLAHRELLDVLKEGQEAMAKRAAAPTILLPGGFVDARKEGGTS